MALPPNLTELLMLVLESGMADAQRRGPTDACTMQDIAEARAWVVSDGREHPFTFVNVCDLLDLDPDAVRKAIQSAMSQGRTLTIRSLLNRH